MSSSSSPLSATSATPASIARIPDGWRRALLTLVAIATFGWYVWSNRLLAERQAEATALRTPLDDAIPFVPSFMLVYMIVYVFLFVPVVQIRDIRLFTRAACTYYAYNWFSLAIMWLWPVRIDRPIDGLRIDSLWTWGAAFNFALDPPYNAFPSLHVSNAFFAGLAAYRLDRPVGTIALALSVAIAASTVLVKQHWIADALGGMLVAWIAFRLIFVPGIPPDAPREQLVFPRRWLGYLASLYVLAIGGLIAGYYLGWRPFPWPPPWK